MRKPKIQPGDVGVVIGAEVNVWLDLDPTTSFDYIRLRENEPVLVLSTEVYRECQLAKVLMSCGKVGYLSVSRLKKTSVP